MTLHYSICFGIMVAEIVIFGVLILPLPKHWRRQLVKFVSKSPLVAKAVHVLKIIFVFVLVLFIDAVNRLQRPGGLDDQSAANSHLMHDMRTEAAFAARKFYAQRNLYLTGFTLFLSLILNRTHQLLVELSAAEEELRVVKGQAGNGDESKFLREQIAELKKKQLDYDTLKKQAAQQNKEFDRLADEHNALEEKSRVGSKENKKEL
ncbi:B-cell receptor-associated protein 31-like-domain-containing protein [Umbelopsis sp. PMI_123]|nr:B-cell receptor-associated protein 31-like-domain-containing protein [Umbelopsis sp. PMI_123]